MKKTILTAIISMIGFTAAAQAPKTIKDINPLNIDDVIKNYDLYLNRYMNVYDSLVSIDQQGDYVFYNTVFGGVQSKHRIIFWSKQTLIDSDIIPFKMIKCRNKIDTHSSAAYDFYYNGHIYSAYSSFTIDGGNFIIDVERRGKKPTEKEIKRTQRYRNKTHRSAYIVVSK